MAIQAIITSLSILSIVLAYWTPKDLRVWGAISGLAAQPFWLFMVFSEHLYGILPLTPTYTLLYLIALRAHLKKAKA